MSRRQKLVFDGPAHKLLIVEGPDDFHTVLSLLQHFQFAEKFRVEDGDGIENLIKSLKTLLRAANQERLGIIADADADVGARWQSFRGVLTDVGYTLVPEAPNPQGTIIVEEGRPIVGIWLMPENTLPGMLEDFLLCLIPAGEPLRERARNCIESIPDADRKFPDHHRSKAEIYTWLAWQKAPGVPFGQAITNTTFQPTGVPQAESLIDWLRRLFVEG